MQVGTYLKNRSEKNNFGGYILKRYKEAIAYFFRNIQVPIQLLPMYTREKLMKEKQNSTTRVEYIQSPLALIYFYLVMLLQ